MDFLGGEINFGRIHSLCRDICHGRSYHEALPVPCRIRRPKTHPQSPKIHRPGFFVFGRARIAVGDGAGFFAAISLIDVERLVEFEQ